MSHLMRQWIQLKNMESYITRYVEKSLREHFTVLFGVDYGMLLGTGKLVYTGFGSDPSAKEATNTAFNFLKANAKRISDSINMTSKDCNINYQDPQGIGITDKLTLQKVISICSIALNRPT